MEAEEWEGLSILTLDRVFFNSEIYNEEIRSEFAETVARDMEKIHQDYASTIRYNDENYKK